jgi:hypothetical protein
MQATQSSTALVEFVESVESLDRSDLPSVTPLKLISPRLDLGVVDDPPSFDGLKGVARDQTSRTLSVEHDSSHIPRKSVQTLKKQRSGPTPDTGVDDRCTCRTLSAGVAEEVGLAHDAGNLLSALSLYSDLLSMPGVLHEGYREYAAELRLLSERSTAMISRLFDHIHRIEQIEIEVGGSTERAVRGEARWIAF